MKFHLSEQSDGCEFNNIVIRSRTPQLYLEITFLFRESNPDSVTLSYWGSRYVNTRGKSLVLVEAIRDSRNRISVCRETIPRYPQPR